jgi:uncharacterized short protein YbdD (DUF466 family)
MRLIVWCWRFLAHTIGEGEYERYCEHLRRRHPDQAALTAREFYLKRLQERYSRPSRCC